MVSKVRNFWLCVFSGVVATTLITCESGIVYSYSSIRPKCVSKGKQGIQFHLLARLFYKWLSLQNPKIKKTSKHFPFFKINFKVNAHVNHNADVYVDVNIYLHYTTYVTWVCKFLSTWLCLHRVYGSVKICSV